MKCKLCGKEFEPKAKTNKFCSQVCSHKWMEIHGHDTSPKDEPPRICSVCGKEYKVRQRTQRYCSEECQKIAKAEYLREYRKRKVDTKPKKKEKPKRIPFDKDYAKNQMAQTLAMLPKIGEKL